MVFGIFCAYFFAGQFLTLLRERDELFRKVEGMNRDLSRMMPIRKMGESAAFISHEIKNYVSVLKSNHLLLKRRLDGAESLDEMDRIGRSTEKLESFVRAILDFSNSAESLRREWISLGQVIQECLSLHFPDRCNTIHVTVQDNLPLIRGERGRLERALLNLIKNSLEAGASRIRIAVSGQDGAVSIDLEDNGEGCDEGVLVKVGSPFFTTKKRMGGTGLGIAITASIMESHGGTMSLLPGVSGRLGKGGFKVRLSFPVSIPVPDPADLRA